MRNGFLGAMLALAAGAGLAWGQYPPGGTFGNPTVIPPQLPPFADPGAGEAGGAPTYPSPQNWDGFDMNGPQGGKNGSVPRWWVDTEYLMWFAKSANYTVPLATTSSPADSGVIGDPSTQIIFGNDNPNYGMLSGFRFGAGTWFDASGRMGMNAEFFSTGSQGQNFYEASNANGSPLLARPFTNNQLGSQSAFVVAAPNYAAGYIYNASSLSTAGGDMNMLFNLYRSAPDSGFGYGLSLVAGFRYFGLSEHVDMISQTSLLNGNSITYQNQTFTALSGSTSTVIYDLGGHIVQLPPGGIPTFAPNLNKLYQYITTTMGNVSVVVNNLDQIHTRNDFYGGNTGLYQQFNAGRWSIGLGSMLGLGDMHQSVDISGGSTLNSTTNTTSQITITQGLLPPVTRFNSSTTVTSQTILSSATGVYNQVNSLGHYQRDTFGIIPEMNLKLAYAFTPAMTGYIGFNAIYVNNVVRAPSEVTASVNPTLQPTSLSYGSTSVPKAFNAFPTSDFWLMGLNFGFNFRY